MNILSNTEPLLLMGNEAIARGALDVGAKFFSCYPGTPSSEVMDTLAAIKSGNQNADFDMEYSVNEKVALEAAAGAALAGTQSMASMKHVGLNVAADPLFTAAYIGLPGGLVILSADDPGCHSSQNEQDNRNYARFANLPTLEPVSPQEAYYMVREAFAMARSLEQPVLLRTTTRVSHMRGPVKTEDEHKPVQTPFVKEAGRYVPVPAVALKRHKILANQMRKAAELAETSKFNKIVWPSGPDVHYKWGIIASGVARNYLADAMLLSGQSEETAILELGMTWPLPQKLIGQILGRCDNVLVLEEGDPLLEQDVRSLAQKINPSVRIDGKDEFLTGFSEFSTRGVANRLARWRGEETCSPKKEGVELKLPSRPPNLCPGCAHRAVYYAVRKIFGDEAVYSSDIGCYTLGLVPPLKTADFLVCMGSSISAGSGFSRASGQTVIGFIGDSTFFHSGMTGLANAIFNKHNILLVILDNGTTAMTGHQPNPGMHQDVLGENSVKLDIESIVKALGVTDYKKVSAYNLGEVTKALETLKSVSGPRVLIAEEPCVLYASRMLKKKKNRVAFVKEQNEDTEKCLKELACPAFFRIDGEMRVDENLCSGCMLCLQIAPRSFGARPRQGKTA